MSLASAHPWVTAWRERSRCPAISERNPSSSTSTPRSAASSRVSSSGKPKVSCKRKASAPEIAFPPRDSIFSNCSIPCSRVRAKRSASGSIVVVDEVDERTEQVGLENVFLSLQDEADPLQAHARVDGRVLQRYKGAVRDAALDRLRGRRRPGQVRPLVVLGQHQVPELGETGA